MRAIWPGALLSVYLALTGALLVAGGADTQATMLHWLLFIAVAATLLPASPAWLRAWAPLLILFFLYAELPTLIAAAGHTQPLDDTVMAWEARLYGSQPSRAWAVAMPSVGVSEALHLAYLSYYPIIYVLPALLWYRGARAEFEVATFALMLTFVACFVCYMAFPVAGPRYLWASAAPEGPFRSMATWLLESGSSRGTAFPSSHVAVAVAQSVLAFRYLGRAAGLAIAMLTTGLAAGAVYGGFHYAVDVLAGALLGALTTVIGVRAMPTPPQANAIAPT